MSKANSLGFEIVSPCLFPTLRIITSLHIHYVSECMPPSLKYYLSTSYEFLFEPSIGRYQVLPHRVRVDLEAMAMKEYSAFPITGTSRSDCFESYLGHLFGESYLSAEKHSVYSTAPSDWAIDEFCKQTLFILFFTM